MADAPRIINDSREKNYISGRKIFLLDVINPTTCAELIGNISNMVDGLEWQSDTTTKLSKLVNPYNLSDTDYQIIDVYINSSGGSISVCQSIMALLNLARAKGAIIRTTIMGCAASCASIIAVQGTPNFRIMYEQSYHLIHHGRSCLNIETDKALDRFYEYEKHMRKNLWRPYVTMTKITEAQLQEMQSAEENYISANDCLNKYKMCDWILNTNGEFIHRNKRTR